MTLRHAQSLLLAASGFFLLLVVFNNITDYGSNGMFIQHVLSMDTTFPGNSAMWRALTSPAAVKAFYFSIILWETAAGVIQWTAAFRLWTAATAEAALRARRTATLGLTLSLLQWFVAFITIGGEWFLMWQSKSWNGQDAAFRMFTVMGICLILVQLKDE